MGRLNYKILYTIFIKNIFKTQMSIDDTIYCFNCIQVCANLTLPKYVCIFKYTISLQNTYIFAQSFNNQQNENCKNNDFINTSGVSGECSTGIYLDTMNFVQKRCRPQFVTYLFIVNFPLQYLHIIISMLIKVRKKKFTIVTMRLSYILEKGLLDKYSIVQYSLMTYV